MTRSVTAAALLTLGSAVFASSVFGYELEGLEIHGFASQGYIKTTKENNFPVGNSGDGSFNFNDFGLNFSKQLTSDLRIGLQLLAMDRSSYGHDKVTLDWAYGDWRTRDWLGFRAGRIKLPLGLYNETRDNDALRTFIFLPQNEYYDYERDSIIAVTGGSIYGTVPFGKAGTLNYQLQLGTLPIASDGGSAMNYSSYISTTDATLEVTDVESKTSFIHHMEWRTPLEGLRATFSGLHTTFSGRAKGTNAATGEVVEAKWKYNKLRRYLFGLEYTYGDMILAAEYQMDDYTVSARYSDPSIEAFRSKQASDGWYASATYRFTDWFELGAYYHETYADRHHRDGSTFEDFGVSKPWNMYQKDTALTLRFDPVPYVVLKVEGHLEKGTWILSETTGAEKKNWYILATKATVSF